MTFEIACSKCGSVLYSGFDLKPPSDVIREFGDRCKVCGAALLVDSFKIEVEKFGGSFVPGHTGVPAMTIPLRVRPQPVRPHVKSEATI